MANPSVRSGNPCQPASGVSCQIGRIGREQVGTDRLPGDIVDAVLAGRVRIHPVGYEWLEEPAAFRTRFLLFEFALHRADLLA